MGQVTATWQGDNMIGRLSDWLQNGPVGIPTVDDNTHILFPVTRSSLR